MKVEATALPGVLLLHLDVHADRRGHLVELFAPRHLEHGIGPFVQDNVAVSRRDVVRGMHWQVGQPQGKLISVLHGRILDVVAEVRPGPRRGHHVAVELAAGSGRQLWVPAGYAHGFCVLSDEAVVLYKNTAPYVPGAGRGVRWDDPTLALPWPVADPVLSDADAALPRLDAIPDRDLP